MVDIVNNDNDLSSELMILEEMVNEQNSHNDPDTLQLKSTKNISAYVQTEETVLVLFDFENPDMAVKKIFHSGQERSYDSTFLIKDSKVCSKISKNIEMVSGNPVSTFDIDPVFYDLFTNPIKNYLVSPLLVNNNILGALFFINPQFDQSNERRKKILELVVKALANAIFAMEHNRKLIVSNADLEASQWEILNSRNTLRTFFDNIPSCVYIIDHSYTIMAINSRRSERVGKAPYELVGGKCYEKLFGNSSPCPLCRVPEAFDGAPAVRNLREWGDQEKFIHWEIATIPIRESKNKINQVIIFDEDITEKWILEANLIQSEKLASIGQLAANVAHEINNPLAAIIANAQLLLIDLEKEDDEILGSIKLIETAGKRAAKIVSNLLESARREKHEEFEKGSLNETILEAINMLQHEIKNRSILVNLDLGTDIPEIFANKNQLKGVWINLISNALGALNSTEGTITISTRYENKQFLVIFVDNGKGITAEIKDKIFEPFFTTKEAGKGTGLGLSVSLQVIKDHHGSIDVESVPGRGAKFIVMLPDIDMVNS